MLIANKGQKKSVYCGQEAMSNKGLLKLSYPTRHGIGRLAINDSVVAARLHRKWHNRKR